MVTKDNKVLMVKHKMNESEYFTIPGGGIEKGETAEQAAVRELREECGVCGTIIKKLSEYLLPDNMTLSVFHMDIGGQIPKLGYDPELSADAQILTEVRWLALNEVCERDRAFLWASGLFYVSPFDDELFSWGDDISYPSKRNL